MITHYKITLPAFSQGFHLITNYVLEAVRLPESGILHLFLPHTSAAISLNEDASPDVRSDMLKFFNKLVPENLPFYEHTLEGPDDMPAHIKTTLVGNSISIPVINGELALGTWQGIYLCEFRKSYKRRKLIISIYD